MERQEYVKLLREYYQKQEIDINNFNCKHIEECSISGVKIYRGSEAYVGQKYGEPFKVLIASLDRGKDSEDIEGRYNEMEEECIKNKRLNPHMKGTLEILKVVFSELKIKEEAELFRHFAMINTAKCCKGKNMEQAPWKFFDNCREYTKAEVEILSPDIIITQGMFATNVFDLLYPDKSIYTEAGYGNPIPWWERVRKITLDNKRDALLIYSVHPSSREKKKFYRFIKEGLPKIMKEELR